MSRTDPQVAVRLPPDVKAFIQAEARENASSQNSEIVRAIRERMKAKGPVEVAPSPSPDHGHPLEGMSNEPIEQ